MLSCSRTLWYLMTWERDSTINRLPQESLVAFFHNLSWRISVSKSSFITFIISNHDTFLVPTKQCQFLNVKTQKLACIKSQYKDNQAEDCVERDGEDTEAGKLIRGRETGDDQVITGAGTR